MGAHRSPLPERVITKGALSRSHSPMLCAPPLLWGGAVHKLSGNACRPQGIEE